MWPMSGAIWWLSHQRTRAPTSAMNTAAQASCEPSICAVLWWPERDDASSPIQ
jgi:hypothetical protein